MNRPVFSVLQGREHGDLFKNNKKKAQFNSSRHKKHRLYQTRRQHYAFSKNRIGNHRLGPEDDQRVYQQSELPQSADHSRIAANPLEYNDEQVRTQAAAAKQATDAKQTNFDLMIADMKTMLHYAEDTVHDDDSKLSEVGWGGRSEPHALQVPGQPRLLEVLQQGQGWLTLDWKKPADGGTTASYRIERRELADGGMWTLAGMAMDIEITLNDQKRGKEWEYRVIAVNKTGESEPSNTVSALL